MDITTPANECQVDNSLPQSQFGVGYAGQGLQTPPLTPAPHIDSLKRLSLLEYPSTITKANEELMKVSTTPNEKRHSTEGLFTPPATPAGCSLSRVLIREQDQDHALEGFPSTSSPVPDRFYSDESSSSSDPGETERSDLPHLSAAETSSPTGPSPVSTSPMSCLQCYLSSRRCDQRRPECSRCIRRREGESHHGITHPEIYEPCLAQVWLWTIDFEVKVVTAVETLGEYNNRVERLIGDDEAMWELKRGLWDELHRREEERKDRANWALPMPKYLRKAAGN